ncbi:DUF4221 family protein [Mongoliitalea daihaiensis]|uniref:DUF4221 family protein n=1 Tax=Mongoliitalea daihaiensis TaxID=2782006 RepID=UPI001F17AC96|nr:DUF4221 family protein [Mongoliitalea daihaiensis]UJP66489.1 DUF4221 family protein [Mongoliitalea daihaiensis]
MRLLFICFLASWVLFSCGSKESEQKIDYSSISFSVDTVMVDPGEEILNLKYGLFVSDMTPDKQFLYLWDPDQNKVNEIDLNALELRNQYPFEKEGPDGVGNTFINVLALVDNNFVIGGFGSRGLFSKDGKKLQDLRIKSEEFTGDSLDVGRDYDSKPIILENGSMMVGLMNNWMAGTFDLVKTDFNKKTIKKLTFPGIEELPDYKIILRGDMMVSITGSDKNLRRVGSRAIFSNSSYADLYVLDMDSDSIRQVSYTPTLTKSRKKGGYPDEVETEKAMEELRETIYEEINFLAPIWDEEKKVFYRFSYTSDKNPSYSPDVEDSPKFKNRVYLTVLNENLELIGESYLEKLDFTPHSAFVKDGMIWSYLNVDDELAFRRIKLNL